MFLKCLNLFAQKMKQPKMSKEQINKMVKSAGFDDVSKLTIFYPNIQYWRFILFLFEVSLNSLAQ